MGGGAGKVIGSRVHGWVGEIARPQVEGDANRVREA